MKTVNLSFVFSLIFSALIGQDYHPYAAFQVGVGFPINQFAEVDTANIGYLTAGAELLFPLGQKLPLRVGLNIRRFGMGERTNNSSYTNQGTQYETQTSVKGAMWPFHAVLRIDPIRLTNFPVMPYAGGVAGFRTFATRSTVVQDVYTSQSWKQNTDEFTRVKWSTSYGYEVGFHIRLNKQLLLDFRYEQAWGGWAEYLDMGSVQFDSKGKASYTSHTSRTDFRSVTVGLVAFLFYPE